MKTTLKIYCYSALVAALFFARNGYSQTYGDFYGNATYRGRAIITSDSVSAYAGSIWCGRHYIIQDGQYGIHVKGDDPATPQVDGAVEGQSITFRINGEVATVVSGSNIWNSGSAKECVLNVANDRHNITIQTNPTNLTFIVDGIPYTSLNTFVGWQEGTTHSFDVTSPQNESGGSRYRFLSWSDGGAQSHSYTVPTSDATITVNFQQQYQLTVSSNHDTPTGSGWYDAGASATFSVTTPVSAGTGARYVLTDWDGTGIGSYTGSDITHTVIMNNEITETAMWKTQYQLTVENGGHGIVTGSGWYDTGSVQTFSIDTTLITQGGTRYAFFSWSGTGAGSYSGSNSEHSISVYNAMTETALWQTQYFLTTTENPNEGGNMTPAPPGEWYDTGVFATVAATPNSGSGYSFTGWSQDLSGRQNPIQIQMTGPRSVTANFGGEVPIVFDTNPSGYSYTVDGISYNQQNTFYWPQGSTHSVSVPSAQGESGGNRYAFASWSDGGGREHYYTTPSSNQTVTANLAIQHKLTVSSAHDTPNGDGWYNHGMSATFSISSLAAGTAGKQYLFIGWTGSGLGCYAGTDTVKSVTMNNPITETAAWKTRFFLTTASSPPNGGLVSPAPPGAWYDSSATAQVSASPNLGSLWLGWSGDLTGLTTPASLSMTAPKTATANFETQIQVTIVTEPAGLSFSADGTAYTAPHLFIWAKNSTHAVTVTSPQSGGTGTRYQFTSWSDGGGQSHSYTVPAADDTLRAVFTTQHLLTLSTSGRGNPTGGGWYNSGTSVRFSVDALVAVSSDTRYRFLGWTSTNAGGYNGPNPSAEITITAPDTQTARWRSEYYVSLACEPAWAGTLSPAAPPGTWASDTLTITASGLTDSSYGFSNWTGSATSSANPLKLVVASPKTITAHFIKGKLLFTTIPAGLELILDDTVRAPAPLVPIWTPGSRHKVEAVDSQYVGVTTRHVFGSWNDGDGRIHDVTTPSGTDTLTATFQTSYFVQLLSEHGTTAGQNWYVKGTTASISVDSPVQANDSLRYRCLGWSENGSVSIAHPTASAVLTVNQPLTETAQWLPQYKLGVVTQPSRAAGVLIHVDPQGPWYDASAAVTLSYEIIDTIYKFLRWEGPVVNTTSNPTTVIMDRAKTVKAVFKVPNDPPVIALLPNGVILEDTVQRILFSQVDAAVTDPNDPDSTLTFEFSSKHVTIEIDSVKREIRLTPELNWFGTDTINLLVRDPFVEEATGSIVLTVLSVNDSPGPVELVSPSNDTALTSWDSPLRFTWKPSQNVDPGDTIQYSFYISSSAAFKPESTAGVLSGTATEVTIMPRYGTTQYWKVMAFDLAHLSRWSAVYRIGINDAVEGRRVPADFALLQNYPNPFNPETVIRFQLPKSGNVLLEVIDVDGRVLKTLTDREWEAGEHQVVWRGDRDSGQPAGSGVYLARMRSGSFIQMRKMMLLR